jgi:hypothetical protein
MREGGSAWLGFLGVMLLLPACGEGVEVLGGFPGSARAPDLEASNTTQASEGFAVPRPPFSKSIFPCMDCHGERKPDPTPRELEEHEQIQLRHGSRDRWCFDCHTVDNRDVLHLAGGAPVPFTESYRLCGQCHGDKFRDWRVGVHGKRSGPKQYLLCVHCHDPHSPRFKPLAPLARPLRPEENR